MAENQPETSDESFNGEFFAYHCPGNTESAARHASFAALSGQFTRVLVGIPEFISNPHYSSSHLNFILIAIFQGDQVLGVMYYCRQFERTWK